jgi:hypothetical protein
MTPTEPLTALRDHYAVLGVDADAGDAEIRAAFRELAKRHHPDVNPGGARAERRFAEISEARTVLLSPTRRAAFDRARDAFLRTGVATDPAPAVPRWEPPRHAAPARALLLVGALTVVLATIVLPLATVQDRIEPAPVHGFDAGVPGGIAWCAACLLVAAIGWPGLRGVLSPARWEALVGVLVLWLAVAIAGQVDPHVLVGGQFSADLAGATGGEALLGGVGLMVGGALLLRPESAR